MRFCLPVLILLLTTCMAFRQKMFFSPYADSIYDLSFKTIDGETVPVSRFKGRKVLFVVLPLSPTDTVLPASALKSVQAKYSSLIIIGIVSVEAGFKKADREKIKNQYKNMLS